MKSVSDFLKNVLYLALLAFFAFDAFVLATLFAPDVIVDNPYSHLVIENQDILVAVFALQTFAYAALTWIVLISPIRKLRRQVAYFIAGVRSTGLPPPKGYPDLTYIIGFFNRSFEILWNFKEEFKAGRVLRSEVELAADIQKHVLKKTDVRAGSLDIVANTKSATEVG